MQAPDEDLALQRAYEEAWAEWFADATNAVWADANPNWLRVTPSQGSTRNQFG